VPGLCGRSVSGPAELCCCHGPGSCGHRALSIGRTVGPSTNNHNPALGEPTSVAPKKRPYKVPREQAAELIASIVTDGWKSAVAEKAAEAFDETFWRSLPRRQRRRRANCKALADLATAMESCMERAHDAVGAIADKGLDWLHRPTLERNIAVTFAKKIPLPGEDQISATVQAIRIFGILLCVEEGLDIVNDCPCFWKLAEDKSKEELEAVLEHKLDALQTSVASRYSN
jgi:hypothetical protein